MKAILALEDGEIYSGTSFGCTGEVVGEVVFNTGMTGYQEVLTDPSYHGQIVTMTYPLVGNYGINQDDFESNKIQVSGFIVKENCEHPSNWRCNISLDSFLKKHNIIGIQGIDTRALTRKLRDKGTMKGIISTNLDFDIKEKINLIKSYEIKNAVINVTTDSIIHHMGKGFRVAVLDFGVKSNIIKSLINRECEVFVFPANTPPNEILKINPDGILLSNGPGDPKDCVEIINNIKELIGKKPIFGICLGHQLIALAYGSDTEKLKYGHRGLNHPVKDTNRGLTYITSQNHGYTIVESTIDNNKILITHRNLNDGTIEGVRYKDEDIFTVQFHPEASPGPKDTAYLFDDFISLMKSRSVKGEKEKHA